MADQAFSPTQLQQLETLIESVVLTRLEQFKASITAQLEATIATKFQQHRQDVRDIVRCENRLMYKMIGDLKTQVQQHSRDISTFQQSASNTAINQTNLRKENVILREKFGEFSFALSQAQARVDSFGNQVAQLETQVQLMKDDSRDFKSKTEVALMTLQNEFPQLQHSILQLEREWKTDYPMEEAVIINDGDAAQGSIVQTEEDVCE